MHVTKATLNIQEPYITVALSLETFPVDLGNGVYLLYLMYSNMKSC